ncbi:MAG: cytidine deaminase [Acholeplasmatales bacterium]|nr:cytidine deaminase [Acholeplasmatales bacterium]
MIDELILKAKEAREASYSPYSKFKVGAAILMKDGTYILGCNVENSSYGLSICAERNALFQMVAKGYKKGDALAMCIIGQTDTPISPCGACRQVMEELLSRDCKIILANLKNDVKEMTIDELLPYSFSEDSLK